MTERLLLDSHILLTTVGSEPNRATGKPALWPLDAMLFASAASLWEIAIKVRLGKLGLGMPLEEFPEYLRQIDFNLLAIDHRHAVHLVLPEPPTRDPFDRLLLAQCAVDGLRLVTLDRALVDHPLAYRPA